MVGLTLISIIDVPLTDVTVICFFNLSIVVSNSKSSISLNKSASIIYEVDIRKIDNDFYGFVFLRNKYYLKHYLGLLLFAIVYTVISLGLMFISSTLAVFFVIGIILLVYSLFSVFILAREISNQSDNTHKTGDGSVSCDKTS